MRALGQLLVITIFSTGLATGPANHATAAEKRVAKPFGVRTTGGELAYEGTKRRRTAAALTPSLGSAVVKNVRTRKPPRAYTPHAGTTPSAEEDVARDEYGNAAGTDYDLARDGAFSGKTVAVLQLYNGEDEADSSGFDFAAPAQALKEKGFKVRRWTSLPDPDTLEEGLRGTSQLWVISSGRGATLRSGHMQVIGSYFKRGRGLYLWGDNDPYTDEANQLGMELLESDGMLGNYHADQDLAPAGTGLPNPGIQPHLVTTGLERLYEGITTARIYGNLPPLLLGSDGHAVASVYEQSGRRAIVDGGFTRLFYKWDTAGTARYVKNAASWLANAERFDR